MPRFNFHLGPDPRTSVPWQFDRHSDEGELIPLRDEGVCKVGARLPPSDPTVDAEYDAK